MVKITDESTLFANLHYEKVQMFAGIDIFFKKFDSYYKIAIVISNYGKNHIITKENLSDLESKIELHYMFDPKYKFHFLVVLHSSSRKNQVKLNMRNVIYFNLIGKAKYEKIDPIFEDELAALTNHRTSVEKNREIIALNDPKKYCPVPFLTLSIMAACIILYFMGINPMPYGISYKMVFMEGKLENLLAFSLFHSSILHLLCNMFSFSWSSIYLEKKIGKVKYLILVLLSSIYCGTMSCVLNYSNHDVNLTTIGLSGVIYAVLGAIIVYMIAEKKKSTIMIIFTLISLLSGFRNTRTDNMVHIAGLVFGIYSAISFIGVNNIVKSMKRKQYYNYMKENKM